MNQADLSAPRRFRAGVALVVILLHVLAIAALIRAFAPDFAQDVARQVTNAFTVTVSTPPPSPTPTPMGRASDAGATAGEAGKRAVPKEIAAPKPRLVIAPSKPAPPVAARGDADSAGARDAGAGTGAGGQGAGTGAGGNGDGQGGGGIPTKPVKLSGEINSARDYPRASRDLRIGDHVIVALTVGTDGRVRACRIQRASRDAEADRITCRLATERFRFRPAADARGEAVEAVYGWQQKWFYPPEKNQEPPEKN